MKLKKENVWNVSGEQVIIASGNATVNAVQNNGIKESQLEEIIKGIMENTAELKREDADEIIDLVEMAKKELTSPSPKISRLKNCIKLLAPMLTIANGTPVLLSNLQRLYDFICLQLHLHNAIFCCLSLLETGMQKNIKTGYFTTANMLIYFW